MKLERANQKIFGRIGVSPTRNQVTAFGSTNATPVFITSDSAQNMNILQGNEYEAGWFGATNDGDKRPYAEDRNSIDYFVTRQLKYIFQNGIPEWDPLEDYFTGSLVRVGSIVYQSVSGTAAVPNTNHNPTTTGNTYWEVFNPQNENSGVIGEIKAYAGNVLPTSHYMWCHGQAISRTTYSTLFSRIGIAYGAGDGNTTFNLPNLQARYIMGRASGVDLNEAPSGIFSRGYRFGTLNHQHVLPPHKHNINALGVASSGAHSHTVVDSGHTHVSQKHGHKLNYSDYHFKYEAEATQGQSGIRVTDVTRDGSYSTYSPVNLNERVVQIDAALSGVSIQSGGAHSHTMTGNVGLSNAVSGDSVYLSTQSTTDPLNVNPPSAVVNFIIKVL